MPAGDKALFVAHDDVAVIALCGREERENLSVCAFDMRAPPVALRRGLSVQNIGDGGWRIVQDAPRRAGQRNPSWPPCEACFFNSVDLRQIGVGRRRGMIGSVRAEECPGRGCARRQSRSFRLKRRAGRLILQRG